MALYTEEAARACLRVKDGKQVFYLQPDDKLTPAAREWLSTNHVEILQQQPGASQTYTTVFGGVLTEKPEHMTHLTGNVLVCKDHPRIAFRGMIDALEAELLLCGSLARQEGWEPLTGELQQALDFVRRMIRCDVLGERLAPDFRLCGLSAEQLRQQSHHPEKFFGQPHFMPDFSDSELLLRLNRARTVARQTELAAYRAFRTTDGAPERGDIMLAMNRLSSLLWILMIRLKAGKYERRK